MCNLYKLTLKMDYMCIIQSIGVVLFFCFAHRILSRIDSKMQNNILLIIKVFKILLAVSFMATAITLVITKVLNVDGPDNKTEEDENDDNESQWYEVGELLFKVQFLFAYYTM